MDVIDPIKSSGGAGSGPRSRVAALAACLVLGTGIAACGSGSEDEPADSSTTSSTEATETGAGNAGGSAAAESTDEVEISDFRFEPETTEIDAGTEVTWTNDDKAPHTATADDSSFDTGTLKLDDTGSTTFDQPGTFSYYCRFHPFMKATVEVK